MPTSIAHAVAGGAVVRISAEPPVRGWALLVLVIVLPNLADADFLMGAFVNSPRDWHRGPTHSLVAAVAAGLLMGVALARAGRRFWPAAVFAFALYASHLVLDVIMPDRRGVPGIPLLWPFWDGAVTAPLPLPAMLLNFLNLPLGETTAGFFESLATWRTVSVFLVEGLLFTPLLLLAHALGPQRAERTVYGNIPRSR